MSDPVYQLDRAKVAEVEPSEGDDKHRTMLSPFAVPEYMQCQFDPQGRLESIKFGYAGKEDISGLELVDELSDPRVEIQTGLYTHKIVWLSFDRPVDRDGLRRVAARLRFKAKSREMTAPARRLSHLMIAALLDQWGDDYLFAQRT